MLCNDNEDVGLAELEVPVIVPILRDSYIEAYSELNPPLSLGCHYHMPLLCSWIFGRLCLTSLIIVVDWSDDLLGISQLIGPGGSGVY